MTVTIAVHFDRAEVLSLNERGRDFARRARMTQAIRRRGAMAWRLAGSPQMDAAHCVCRVDYPDKRARDVHNLLGTTKPLIDGMVHPYVGVRGLLPDDSDDYLIGPDMRRGGGVVAGRYVFTLTFEETPPCLT